MDRASKPRVLVVDDSRSSCEALAALLGDEEYEVAVAGDGRAALSVAEASPPDLVLTDLQMPDLGGLGLLRKLREHPGLSEVPVIIMSAHHDSQHRIEAFQLGADDFIPKPVEFPELSLRIQRHLYRSRRQQDAFRLSVSDPLTGIFNRRGIDNFFTRSRAELQPRGAQLSVLLLDVDRFKAINDRFGHAAGDTALCAVARMLQNDVRATDGLGRVGGDEFLVVLPGAGARVAEELLTRLRAQLPLRLTLSDAATVAVTFSAGAASTAGQAPLEDLIARADRAMYEDKRRLSAEPLPHEGTVQ